MGGFFWYFYSVGVKPSSTKNISVGDGNNIRAGLISDTQLNPYNNGEHENYYNNLIDALKILKEQKAEIIIHAGDVGDMNSKVAYKTYNKALEEVFGNDIPETITIMGNHDTWWNTDWKHTKPKARNFTGVIDQSPWSHTVVNGYHFIAASPDGTENTEGYSQEVINWLDKQIQEAINEDSSKPVFVITHHNPQYTVYGSDEWYDNKLDPLFSKYEQVVSISGHSHYSIMDERSIYQNNYTAFTTQGLAYCNLSKLYYDPFRNGKTDMVPKEENFPMMEIMNVGKDEVTIERWNVKENKEEKADMRWTLSLPLSKDTFKYTTEARKAVNKAPVMDATSKVEFDPSVPSTLPTPNKEELTLPGISFKAGNDDDFVHSYKVIVSGYKDAEYLYLSDFASGISLMSDTVRLALDKNLPNGEYKIKVYAVDSYGETSKECVEGTINLTR